MAVSPEGGGRARGRGRDPKAKFAALVGRIDGGPAFSIAPGKKNTMRAHGHLWLFVNDAEFEDNGGEWVVTLELDR